LHQEDIGVPILWPTVSEIEVSDVMHIAHAPNSPIDRLISKSGVWTF